MRHLLAALTLALVAVALLVSPPEATAFADGASPLQAPSPAPSPAPTPAPPKPADCAACVQCVAGCGTAYADCTRKCFSLPDIPSQQACVAQCPAVHVCAQACPCAGCANIPGLPH
jgi:hypothetical protein